MHAKAMVNFTLDLPVSFWCVRALTYPIVFLKIPFVFEARILVCVVIRFTIERVIVVKFGSESIETVEV